MSQTSPIILPAAAACSSLSCGEGGRRRGQTPWAGCSSTAMCCFVLLACFNSEELRFRSSLGLQPGVIFLGVHKHQELWGISLWDASHKPWSVLPTFHKALGADILEWIYVQECTFPVELLNWYALADAPSRFICKTQVIISDRERKEKQEEGEKGETIEINS